ncbi:MAG: N-6 DNA methylase [Candidatus Obscuribacterales bacterium]|nr:N-6 DNA methylase [Candidatus Obscuribacterales bacterium]
MKQSVDSRDSLTKLRKAYRSFMLKLLGPSVEECERQIRLESLTAIVSLACLWRWSSVPIRLPWTSEILSRPVLLQSTGDELNDFILGFHGWVGRHVATASLPIHRIAKADTLLRDFQKNAEVLELFGCRAGGYFYQFFAETDRKRAQKKLARGDKQSSVDDVVAFTQIYTPDFVTSFLLKEILSRIQTGKGALAVSPRDPKRKGTGEKLTELRVLDPSCGCGNFLLPAFDLLFARQIEAGVSPAVAANAVLSDSICGADIDDVALWICGAQLLTRALEVAPNAVIGAGPLLINASNSDNNEMETGSLCRDWAKDNLLARKYDVVVTNPPYLGRRLLDRRMKNWLRKNYPDAHHDLSAAFLQRALELLKDGGRLGFITQSSVLYLPSYSSFRRNLIENRCLNIVAELGTRAFPMQTGEKVNSVLLVIENNAPDKNTDIRFIDLRDQADKLRDLDDLSSPKARSSSSLQNANVIRKQSEFLQYENYALSYDCPAFLSTLIKDAVSLGSICDIKQGLATSDNNRFLRYWWDVPAEEIGVRWIPYVKGAGEERWWAPVETVVDWGESGQAIKNAVAEAYPYLRGKTHWVVKNESYYFKPGLTFSFINTGCFAARVMPTGCIFDVAGSALFPEEEVSYGVLAWLNSSFAGACANVINPTLNMQVGDLRKLPVLQESLKPLNDMAMRCCELKRRFASNRHLDVSIGCEADSVNLTEFLQSPDQYWKSYATTLQSAVDEMEWLEAAIDNQVFDAVVRHENLSPVERSTLFELCRKQSDRRRKWAPEVCLRQFATAILTDLTGENCFKLAQAGKAANIPEHVRQWLTEVLDGSMEKSAEQSLFQDVSTKLKLKSRLRNKH